jgi:hypothetical protein
MTIKRAKIELQCGNKNIICYFFDNHDSIIEIDQQEYLGFVDIEKTGNNFYISIEILDYLKKL